jgi:hypothetical protein
MKTILKVTKHQWEELYSVLFMCTVSELGFDLVNRHIINSKVYRVLIMVLCSKLRSSFGHCLLSWLFLKNPKLTETMDSAQNKSRSYCNMNSINFPNKSLNLGFGTYLYNTVNSALVKLECFVIGLIAHL